MENLAVWLTISVYVVIMVAISIITGRNSKSVADLTVGGRNAGAWLSALSYGTAYFSAVMFIGYAGGTGVKFGLWGVFVGLGNAIFGSWLAWKMLARRTRDTSQRMKIKSMPQFFEKRYESKNMKFFSAIVIFIFLIPYSASVYKGIASVADVLLGIDDTICLIIIAVLSMLILVLGGYVAQARADFVQGIVMMFGVAALIFVIVRSSQVNGLAGIMEYTQTEKGLPKLTASGWLSLIATVLMTSFGTWGLPQMIQKYFGIKDDKQAKRGVVISTFFAVLVAGGGYFIGSLCHMFLDTSTVAQDYVVPNMLKMVNMPGVLLGIVIVLLLSASVSTLSSITLTAGSIFAMDLVKGKIKPNMEEKKVSTLTKILCVLFIALSYFVANTDTPILDMMSYSWGIISGSFLAPYVIALYWKGLNRFGAWAAMLCGFSIAIIPAIAKIIIIAGVTDIAVIQKLATQGPIYAVAAMLVSIAVSVGVSAITNKTKDIQVNDLFYNGVVENEYV